MCNSGARRQSAGSYIHKCYARRVGQGEERICQPHLFPFHRRLRNAVGQLPDKGKAGPENTCWRGRLDTRRKHQASHVVDRTCAGT